MLFFFFFQAEDGIRDYKVTGVQTCALPICRRGRAAGTPARPQDPGARRLHRARRHGRPGRIAPGRAARGPHRSLADGRRDAGDERPRAGASPRRAAAGDARAVHVRVCGRGGGATPRARPGHRVHPEAVHARRAGAPRARGAGRVTPRRADLTLLLATAMWGTSFVAGKSGPAYATPLAFLAVRFGIAALLLPPGTPLPPPPPGRELAGGLLLGALVAVGVVSVTLGLPLTTPARSAFIVAISSVLAPLIAFVVLGQRPGWLAAAALAFAGVGMYFLTPPDAGGLNRGDLLTLICALCFGGQIVGSEGRRVGEE